MADVMCQIQPGRFDCACLGDIFDSSLSFPEFVTGCIARLQTDGDDVNRRATVMYVEKDDLDLNGFALKNGIS